ncbi:c-type cytochrome [Chitinophaga flava]|uniref:Cytochrome c domain-containing protein n=1 Tax=Chitinophaga flava TaxID=2259036 RepID=A0A365Y1D4_9BACT|nr:c-type cytochrome [Chitinophaga flava]RBL92423.1 hypothetical protein DF182_07525 [Chitinophaga flava]
MNLKKKILPVLLLTLSTSLANAQKVERTYFPGTQKVQSEMYPDSAHHLKILKEYYESGKRRRISNYHENGSGLTGDDVVYHENGKISDYRFWKEGVPEGRAYATFTSGKLAFEKFYRNGFRSGTWKFYNEDGSLARKQVFKENTNRWDDETELAVTSFYQKGKLVYEEEITDYKTKQTKIIDKAAYDKLMAKNPLEGKALFLQNCASCHNAKVDLVGPKMEGIGKIRSEEWLYKMITNGDALRDSGDKTAMEVYEKWQHIRHHPNFEILKQEEVKEIIQYLKSI